MPMAIKTVMISYIVIIAVLMASGGAEAIIGVNWGRYNAQRLVPTQVVDMLLQNGITHARIYSLDEDVLKAFYLSGINLTVTVKNATAFTSMEDARAWVLEKSIYFDKCNIRAIYMGGYVFDNIKNPPYIYTAMKSLQYLQTALNEVGYGAIKATFLHYIVELNNITKPSEADFLDETKGYMLTFLRFLQQNNAPFVVETFPLGDSQFYNLGTEFAFPDNKGREVKDVNGAVYRNIFEFTYDAFFWALKKNNVSDLKIIMAQVGWPTDGTEGGTIDNAERYYKYLLPWLSSSKGTPMQPGASIDTYVHALTDENRLDMTFTRHWGIYRSNGLPKYKLDLSGQGRDIFPTTIKGIMRMPNRWCVYDSDRTNLNKVRDMLDLACRNADCSSIAPGGSCGNLSFEDNVSFAFNIYFQFQFQDELACDFGGLAYVTAIDPSIGSCVFPVEVVKGQQINYVEPTIVNGLHHRGPSYRVTVTSVLLSVLGAIIWD